MSKSITSANSLLTLTASSRNVAVSASGATGIEAVGALAGLLGVPTTIEGWAADATFSMDQQNSAEVVLGIDGRMHVGWVPFLVPLRISLMPDSDSQDYLTDLATVQREMRETLAFNGVLIIPSIKRKYALSNGALTGFTILPTHNRVLGAQNSVITFEKCIPAAY